MKQTWITFYDVKAKMEKINYTLHPTTIIINIQISLGRLISYFWKPNIKCMESTVQSKWTSNSHFHFVFESTGQIWLMYAGWLDCNWSQAKWIFCVDQTQKLLFFQQGYKAPPPHWTHYLTGKIQDSDLCLELHSSHMNAFFQNKKSEAIVPLR